MTHASHPWAAYATDRTGAPVRDCELDIGGKNVYIATEDNLKPQLKITKRPSLAKNYKVNKVKVDDDYNWIFVPGKDIAGEGDVHKIDNWAPSHTLDDLKKMVITKGWSGVTLGKAGTWAKNTAFFKHVKYELTEEKTRDNADLVDGIWICKPMHHREIGGWRTFKGYDKPNYD